MKKVLVLAVAVTLIFAGYLAFTTVDSKTPSLVAAAKTYSGTLYVAGMGGHFAKADVTIDPNDSSNPIKATLDRIVIGDKVTHATHDPRVDVNDRNILMWSTFKADKDGKLHVGKTDLKTGEKITDVTIAVDARAKGPAPIYCASGQSKTSYMPMTMSTEAYIDVFDKATLKLKHRVFLDSIGYKKGTYQFFHGINTPDMKNFLVVVNMLGADGKPSGHIELVFLDLAELEKGKVKMVAGKTLTGEPGKTIAFRQSFTNDGKYLLQSGRDRMYLLNAKTLELLKEEMIKGGAENHDVIPTPDGKYAILSLRETFADAKEGPGIQDGTIQLFDIEAKKLVGKSVSTCAACHNSMGVKGSAVLCGLDANWK